MASRRVRQLVADMVLWLQAGIVGVVGLVGFWLLNKVCSPFAPVIGFHHEVNVVKDLDSKG